MQDLYHNKIGDLMQLYKEYELNKITFKDDFKDSSDFLFKELIVDGTKIFVSVMDGLVDSLNLSHSVIEPMLSVHLKFSDTFEQFNLLQTKVIHCAEQNVAESFEDAYFFLMSGFAIVVVDGCDKALCLGVQGWNKRTTDEPSNEANVKGAKECFVESINDNKALIRKRLKTYHLKQKQLKLGSATKTPVVISYIEGRADKELIKAVENRLNSANFNSVIDYGEIKPFLDTNIKSFFSAAGTTERPDVLASKLLEGRVAVMVEGTPCVIYVPYLFSDNFSSLDDYDNPPFYSTFIRLLKYFSFIISLLLPALFVAVGTFHQEMIPTNLLYLIATNESTTPFNLTAEAILVHLLYEIMREAGLRLPESIGHAVSIIGAIVIGDAAVSAGIIGAPMLILVAVTAISSYVIFPLYESLAVLRILFIIIGGTLGIFGIMIALSMLFCNICALEPYGIPYSAPISPLTKKSFFDTVFRQSWQKMADRKVRINSLEGADLND